jgi:hypothetical protein
MAVIKTVKITIVVLSFKVFSSLHVSSPFRLLSGLDRMERVVGKGQRAAEPRGEAPLVSSRWLAGLSRYGCFAKFKRASTLFLKEAL